MDGGQRAPSWGAVLASAAPAAALVAGVLSAFTDFRALREPILLMMVVAVALSAASATRGARERHVFWTAVVLGAATWAGSQMVYVALQIARQEPFEADLFGPQWSQALGLVAAHAAFLGVPTGIAAGTGVIAWRRVMTRRIR